MSEAKTYFAEQRRLHPTTLIYRGITSIPGMAIPIYFIFVNKDTSELFYIGLAVLYGLLVLPMLILSWYYFHFWISPKELIIRQGIISKKQRNIPLERIQNIEIQQNFLQRLLGIARVKAETAGDIMSEGVLEYVSREDAEDIRGIIRSYQKELEGEEEDDEEETAASEEAEGAPPIKKKKKQGIIFKMSLRELAVYGMLRFRPLVLVAAFTLYQYFAVSPESFFLEQTEQIKNIFEADAFTIISYIILGILIAMFISWLADIALTINQYYGFTLSYEDSKLHSEYGLLGKRKGIIPLKKLQSIVLKSNIITRKLKLYSLDLQTAGIGKSGGGAESALPLAKYERVVSLIKDIKEYDMPGHFEKVSKKTIRRAVFRYMMLVIPFTAAAYFVLPALLWLLILTPLLYLAALLRYQYRGYALMDDYVVIKQGFIYQKISFIPIEKIQTLNMIANFFQRRLGLASLNIDTAATSGFADASIIDVAEEDAEELLTTLADKFKKKYAVEGN